MFDTITDSRYAELLARFGGTRTEPVLRVVCAWCSRVLVNGDAPAPVSHGMCNECLEREMREEN